MPVFGGYETVRELYRSGLASASTARKTGGDGADRFVVKAYQPFAAGADPEHIQQELEAFLDGAKAQQKAVAEGAKHWVAVHEVGTVEGGAYFVSDYHPRSVQHLIRGRVKLDGAGLCRIISSVLQGLIEFRRACNRSHGNLKPSNILLTGRKDISRSEAMLTDPAGATALDPKMGNVPDLHAIGELSYQLVLHRPGKAMGGWPAPEAKEWDRLGKNGADWRQLCNRLLNPNLAPGLLTFEDLAGDLKKLRSGGGGAKKLLVGGVVLALLVGGAVAAVAVRADPRATGERIHLQTRVVGEHRHPEVSCEFTRLLARVGLEGRPVLAHFGQRSHVLGRQELTR